MVYSSISKEYSELIIGYNNWKGNRNCQQFNMIKFMLHLKLEYPPENFGDRLSRIFHMLFSSNNLVLVDLVNSQKFIY